MFTCPFCGLPQERVATLDNDWVMLEPGMEPLAHTVPAERRWVMVSDGRVSVSTCFGSSARSSFGSTDRAEGACIGVIHAPVAR